MNDKMLKPPYTSYRSFQNLISELREYERTHQMVPAVIDRSLLSRRSGSEQSALIAALKWFELVADNGTPTQLLHDYVETDDSKSAPILRGMVEKSYALITNGKFDLRRATTNQMAEQFRQYDISGSTLYKCIGFFLAAAKEAGIPVSPLVKAPVGSSNGGAKRKPRLASAPTPVSPVVIPDVHLAHKTPQAPGEDMVAIPIPIYGGLDGVIYLPGNMTEKQWSSVIKMTEFILQNYRETMAEQAAEAEGRP